MNDLDALLKSRGVTKNLGAHVTACVFNRSSSKAAFALGDGTIHFTDVESWTHIKAHDGAVLALAQDISAEGFLSGGDDGKFNRVSPEGVTLLAEFGMKWVDHAASFASPKAGLLACTVGKNLHLFDGKGEKIRSFAHPSTVTGIAFDAKGKRVAASHYNGASMWFTGSNATTPRLLEWKGSHIGVAVHPEGEAVVTAMQENALHGWRLSDGQHMRMTGYPAKTESMGFTRNGKWLASSGADSIVLWPFFGGGPMGKPPVEIAQIEGIVCTRVACHPRDELVAAGYANGVVLIAQIGTQRVVVLTEGGPAPVSALAWSPDGARLMFGTESGLAALVDLSPR